jgi:hypothetical protein
MDLVPFLSFIDNNPFKEMFHFVQTLPKLGGSSNFRIEEIIVRHVFCL